MSWILGIGNGFRLIRLLSSRKVRDETDRSILLGDDESRSCPLRSVHLFQNSYLTEAVYLHLQGILMDLWNRARSGMIWLSILVQFEIYL